MNNGRIEGAGLVMMLAIAVTVVFTTVFSAMLFAANRHAPLMSPPVLAQDAPAQTTPESAHAALSNAWTPPEWNVLSAYWERAYERANPGLELAVETGYAAR